LGSIRQARNGKGAQACSIGWYPVLGRGTLLCEMDVGRENRKSTRHGLDAKNLPLAKLQLTGLNFAEAFSNWPLDSLGELYASILQPAWRIFVA